MFLKEFLLNPRYKRFGKVLKKFGRPEKP